MALGTRGRAIPLRAWWAVMLAAALPAACGGSSAPAADAGIDSRLDATGQDRAEAGALEAGPREVVGPDSPGDLGRDGPDDLATPDSRPDHPDAGDGVDRPGTPGGRRLDLLFVVDDSHSMAEEQARLAAGFPAFMRALEAFPGGPPDTRIGVVSTDLGAGPTAPSAECEPSGERGRLQVKPGCALEAGARPWLAFDRTGARNFQGELPAVFSCLAALGTRGCGYEHTLQAVRGALSDTLNPENAGFLRPDALLGIVIISDEDDCSGEPDAEFYRDPVPGQAGSLRCGLLGVVCGGEPVPAQPGFRAPLSSCVPYVRSDAERRSRLINVADFVESVKAAKGGRADRVFVGTIAGWEVSPQAAYALTTQPAAGGLPGQDLDVVPVCQSPTTGKAAPAVRLASFTQAFPNHALHTICADDLAPALGAIAARLSALLPP